MNGVKRYPIRGFFAGLLLGLGVAFMLIVTSQIALGTLPPLIIVVVGIVLGVLWAMFGPTRGRRGDPEPAMAGAPASGAGPMPDESAPTSGAGPMPDESAPTSGAGPMPDEGAPAAGEGPPPE